MSTKQARSIFLFCCILPLLCARQVYADSLQRPRLVVGIVVDQMRWDFLYRYHERYTDGGFRRLLREGFSCENTHMDVMPTFTAVGHATVYTGSVPSIHGIASNDFIIQSSGKSMYCTEDSLCHTVGSNTAAGRMSPRNMEAATIGDELRIATNFRSKVIGIALKDRGSILPAGHSANAAYWFDRDNGNWVSSSYYMHELPHWVRQLNDRKLPETYLSKGWEPVYPAASYVQSLPDDNPHEGKFPNTQSPTLPISGKIMKQGGIKNMLYTPYGNTLTLDMARAAIRHEQLGMRGVTDLLAVSFSSTDYIGHLYGPNSVEVEDTYIRLDRELASFFTYLDSAVGAGQYTVFLTADHGVAHNPGWLKDKKIPSGFWSVTEVAAMLNQMLEKKYGVSGLVINLYNYQVNFNRALVDAHKLDIGSVKQECIRILREVEGVLYVVDMDNVLQEPVPQLLRERIIKGYHRERSGPVQIMLKPGWYSSGYKTGTTHGSWAPYDSHIPLVWMGHGIRNGKSNRLVHMSDIASTLAALLHIQEPNGNIGQPVTEVLAGQ